MSNEDDFNEGVIYSNSITEVADTSYKLYNEPSSDSYDINKIDISTKKELELSSLTKMDSSTNYSDYNSINKEEKLDDDDNVLNIPMIVNEKEKEKEEQKNNEDNQNKNILLYGNDINNLYPKYIGKMLSLFYVKNEPLITIGPDCKLFFIFLFLFI